MEGKLSAPITPKPKGGRKEHMRKERDGPASTVFLIGKPSVLLLLLFLSTPRRPLPTWYVCSGFALVLLWYAFPRIPSHPRKPTTRSGEVG